MMKSSGLPCSLSEYGGLKGVAISDRYGPIDKRKCQTREGSGIGVMRFGRARQVRLTFSSGSKLALLQRR